MDIKYVTAKEEDYRQRILRGWLATLNACENDEEKMGVIEDMLELEHPFD